MFYYYWAWGKENRLLYQGLCYTEVYYMEVPLYLMYVSQSCWLVCIPRGKGHQQPPRPAPPPLPPPSMRPIQVLSLTLSEEVRLAFLILNGASICDVSWDGL